jgi:hypothetical protein
MRVIFMRLPSHAVAAIASGVDVVQIARRAGDFRFSGPLHSAKCLIRLDGDVAEWLKAAVC